MNNYVEILLLSPISDISVSVLFLFSLNVFSIILDSSGMLKGSKVVGYKITNLKRGWLLIVICYFNFLVWFHDYIKIKIFHLPQYKYVPVLLLILLFSLQFLLIHFHQFILILELWFAQRFYDQKEHYFWWLPSSVSFFSVPNVPWSTAMQLQNY